MTRAILVTGSGGVGKTTTAGMLGLMSAAAGERTLVLTVDPARRLAQALGIDGLGPEPHVVTDTFSVAMLDPGGSWESLVRRHTDGVTADRLVSSRFFRAIADRFPAGQAYAAAEEAAGLIEAGEYDTIVVDTPPFGGGADFFDAPRQIRDLVAGRALRVLTGPPLPGRQALFGLTARPALRLADRLLGGPLLEDLGVFLVDLRTTYDGIRARATTVHRIILGATTVVVATPDPGPVAEARSLLARSPGADRYVVLNRTVPTSWIGLGDPGGDAFAQTLHAWGSEALRHRAVEEAFIELNATVALVPWVSDPPTDLDALSALAQSCGLDALLR